METKSFISSENSYGSLGEGLEFIESCNSQNPKFCTLLPSSG